MDVPWLHILSTVAGVFLTAGAGAMSRWLGWLTHETDDGLLRLTLRLLFPCMIFHAVAGNAALREPANLLVPPLFGFCACAGGIGLAAACARLPGSWTGLRDTRHRRTFALSVGLFNYGFIPIPLVSLLYHDTIPTLGVLFVHNVGVELSIWTVGVLALTGGGARSSWRNIINPPAIAILVALAGNATDATQWIPSAVLQAIKLIGSAAIPMSLLLVGATMIDQWRQADTPPSRGEVIKSAGWAAILRLALLPSAFLSAAYLLPLSVELDRVVVVEAAMTSAIFPVVMARIYDGDSILALRIAIATSLVGIITIPLWL
ncbi:MAG: AEC family transporter, partial [Planctomycetales bacterium]|nr:AEC family transporter [Planctomycetales bacterium]